MQAINGISDKTKPQVTQKKPEITHFKLITLISEKKITNISVNSRFSRSLSAIIRTITSSLQH